MREFETVRVLFGLLDRDLKLKAAGLAGLAVIAALLELGGALGVVWLIGMLTDPGALARLPFVGSVVGRMAGDEQTLLLWLCAGVAGFYVLKNGFLLVQSYLQLRLPYAASTRVSSRLFSHYIGMPYVEHLQRNSAELVRNVGQSVDVLFRMVMVAAISIVSEAVVAVVLLTALIVVSPWHTLLSAIGLVVVVGFVVRVTQLRMGSWGEENQRLSGAMLAAMNQAFGGIKDVKVYGRQDYFNRSYHAVRARLSEVQCLREATMAVPRLLLETALVLLLCGFAAVAAMSTGSRAELVLLLAFYAYAGFRLMPSVSRLAVSLQNIRFGSAAIRDLRRDIELANVAADRTAGPARIEFAREIRLEGISFAYPQSDRGALRGVDLVIGKGETFGIAGATGAGKTTLIDIVLGLIQPTQGRLVIDGQDVTGEPRGWQAAIGNVPQFPYLLDDTLKRNIAFGVAADEIDKAALAEAIRVAQLGDVVASRSEGLDAIVGERGVRLSGGQRQRIAIARAVYRNPAVLVFDEATSSLDNTTERAVTDAIFELAGSRTLIVVAHRLSTIQRCDRIAFLKAGRVVGVGSYRELVETVPEFAEMAGGQAFGGD
jgi:ABC-type multidrug transport system fused ATPase/permease subunit